MRQGYYINVPRARKLVGVSAGITISTISLPQSYPVPRHIAEGSGISVQCVHRRAGGGGTCSTSKVPRWDKRTIIVIPPSPENARLTRAHHAQTAVRCAVRHVSSNHRRKAHQGLVQPRPAGHRSKAEEMTVSLMSLPVLSELGCIAASGRHGDRSMRVWFWSPDTTLCEHRTASLRSLSGIVVIANDENYQARKGRW